MIRDHIALTQVRHEDGSILAEKQYVLAPTPGIAWDSEHACNPDVVAGGFHDGATTYSGAMFYLGCDVTTCKHNQIGVAFTQSLLGPWVKYSANPIIPFASYSRWGVGQSSTVSIDHAGR